MSLRHACDQSSVGFYRSMMEKGRVASIDNLLGLRASGGNKRTRADQLRSNASLRKPSLRSCSPPIPGIFAAFLDDMRVRTSDGAAVDSVG